MRATPDEPKSSPAERLQRFPRAQKLFLGMIDLQSRTDAEAAPLEVVQLLPKAQGILLASLSSPGTLRSGPLFGLRSEGVIRVTEAAPGRVASLPTEARSGALALDPHYVLGWSDCLTAFGSTDVDWVGHWLIAPDNTLGTLAHHLDWLSRAQQAGFADEEHFVLLLGKQDERVEYTAYLARDSLAVVLPVARLDSSHL